MTFQVPGYLLLSENSGNTGIQCAEQSSLLWQKDDELNRYIFQVSTQASTSSVGDGCGSTCLVSIWSTFHGSNVFTFMNIGSKSNEWVI